MVTAKLKYNPYLCETVVEFNGKAPKINSLVEKYKHSVLHDWVQEIPSIFHDEMNGYGFELEFTGTELDFEDVRKAFLQKGVSPEQVKVVHAWNTDSRINKSSLIDDLFAWIENNKNDIFNYESLRHIYAELIDSPYPLILVCSEDGEKPVISWLDVLPEIITDVSLLDNTDLKKTPIVICVDENNLYHIQTTSKNLRRRLDVSDKQLFFIIKENISTEEVVRIIKDSGIEHPQIINTLDDEALRNYMEMYPVTEYIQEIIRILNDYINDANRKLENECIEGEVSNSAINESIADINEEINSLKKVDESILLHENRDYSSDFEMIKNKLLSIIGNWRKKKTKITSEEEAEQYSKEFEEEIIKQLDTCAMYLNNKMQDIKGIIDIRVHDSYRVAEIDSEFVPFGVKLAEPIKGSVPQIGRELLEIKTEQYVTRKEGGNFFAQNKNQPEVSVKIVTYYNQEWRNHAIERIKPLTDELIKDRNDKLITYETELVNAYERHVQDLINQRLDMKENAISKLTEKEKKLQNDISWLSELRERVESIERD